MGETFASLANSDLLINRDSLICFNEFFTILNHRLLVIEKSLHRLLVKENMGLVFLSIGQERLPSILIQAVNKKVVK